MRDLNHNMQHSGVRTILVNTLFLSGARVTSILARLVYAIVIAKLLGPELYGRFNYGLSWYLLFVPLSGMGIDFILLRDLGRHENNEALLNNSIAIRSVSTIGVACLCLGLGWILENESQMRSLLLFFSFALAGRGLTSWTNAVFNGSETSCYVLRQEVLFRLLDVIFGIILLASGYGILTLAAVHAACWVLQGITGVAIIRKFLQPTLHPRWDFGTLMDLIRRGSPFLGAAFLLNWLTQGPLVLFRHLSSNGIALGQLALALQVFVLIGSIVAELSSAALPVLSRSVHRQDGKAGQFVATIFWAGWLISGMLIIATLSVGQRAVGFLFGAEFIPAARLLPWATALVGPFFWCTNFRSVLAAEGHYSTVLGANFAGAAVFTAVFIPFGAHYGTRGTFIALALGFLSLVSIQLWKIRQVHPLDWSMSLMRPMFAVLIAVTTCVTLMPAHPCFGLIIGLITLVVAYLSFGLISLQKMRTVLKSLL